MQKIILLITFVAQAIFGCSQKMPPTDVRCVDPQVNKKVSKMLSHTVEAISVPELYAHMGDYTLLDTRELDEYIVSRIPGALHLGYDNPNYKILDSIPKDKPLVVYCSIGYRSEKIGEKLQKQGFTNVKNLYGSIFEWANQGHTLYDPREQPTQKVHTYNKKWSKWLKNENYEKVY